MPYRTIQDLALLQKLKSSADLRRATTLDITMPPKGLSDLVLVAYNKKEKAKILLLNIDGSASCGY